MFVDFQAFSSFRCMFQLYGSQFLSLQEFGLDRKRFILLKLCQHEENYLKGLKQFFSAWHPTNRFQMQSLMKWDPNNPISPQNNWNSCIILNWNSTRLPLPTFQFCNAATLEQLEKPCWTFENFRRVGRTCNFPLLFAMGHVDCRYLWRMFA